MASLFSDAEGRGAGGDDIAIFRFTVETAPQNEDRLWATLQDARSVIETEIRETVVDVLGPDYKVSGILFARGSFHILIVIGSAVLGTYVAISRYRNFVESVNVLFAQLRRLIQRFFETRSQAPVATTGTWIPGTILQNQNGGIVSAGRDWVFAAVVVYLILSHAALLGVLIWRVLHH